MNVRWRWATCAVVLGLAVPGRFVHGGEVLSRPVTVVNLGGTSVGPAPALARPVTVVNLGMPATSSAPVLARVFTVWKDGGTTDAPGRGADPRPLTFLLRPASPNPMHRITRLEYELADARPVRLDLLDASGRRIRTLARSASQAPGRYVVEWNGLTDDGETVPAGVYWLRLVAGSFDQSRKIVLLRD